MGASAEEGGPEQAEGTDLLLQLSPHGLDVSLDVSAAETLIDGV